MIRGGILMRWGGMSSVESAISDLDDRRALCDVYIPWLVTGIDHGLYNFCPLSM